MNESDGARSRLRRGRRRLAAVAAVALVAIAVSGGVFGVWLRGELKGSLPRWEGELPVPGLAQRVTVVRDELGVPEIRARSEADAWLALGFLHGQERYFQMDLSRRSAAGELAELFGEPAVDRDRQARVHGFRELAERAVDRLPARQRKLLEAYTRGVNAGLTALRAAPFEYLLLRSVPSPWRPEDSVLVVFSMYDLLQDETGRIDRQRAAMAERLPPELASFLWPDGGRWDAALDGTTFPSLPIPGPEVVDLREQPPAPRRATKVSAELVPGPPVGSNAWAVAGSRRGGGAALVANDMHLPITLPNTWYRARVRVVSGTSAERAPLDVTGASLPGVPGVIVGSNGHVAWGFTNSYADTTDLVVVELDPEQPDRYRTADGWREIEMRRERIEVARGEPVIHEVRDTIWGPIVGEDPRGRPLAVHWVARIPGAADLGLLDMLRAETVEQAVDRARRSGLPAQNLVVGDWEGSIAWTIAGPLPERIGLDGRHPRSWADGTRRWDGLLSPRKVPALIDPPSGLLWSANNRMVGGRALEVLGDGGYALGARAQQIRDRLQELDTLDERRMLELQRDDRAVFLSRWHRLLVQTLTAPRARQVEQLSRARQLLERWEARATVDSVGYRLVRGFRRLVARSALYPLLEPCREAPGGFAGLPGRRWEYPLWALVHERPMHLLDPRFESWEALLLDAAESLVEQLTADGEPLETKTWGSRNVFHARHPLSLAVPGIGRWVDLPPTPLSGDRYMPLVQGDDFGASQRMAVAPGREDRGIFHMPGGQSGHPASPHYAAGHQAWVERAPAPFLPKRAMHELTLLPASE